MGTRRCAAEGLLEKAEQLIRLPQTVWHGYGQPAGVGLAAIRTASGDEDGHGGIFSPFRVVQEFP